AAEVARPRGPARRASSRAGQAAARSVAARSGAAARSVAPALVVTPAERPAAPSGTRRAGLEHGAGSRGGRARAVRPPRCTKEGGIDRGVRARDVASRLAAWP